MVEMLRSKEMALCQLFLQTEAAYRIIARLGELGIVEIRDMQVDVNVLGKKFVAEVKRCDEIEKKLKYIEKSAISSGVTIVDCNEKASPIMDFDYLVNLETEAERIFMELKRVNNSSDTLKKSFLELSEINQVLLKTRDLYMEDLDSEEVAEESEKVNWKMISTVSGVLSIERIPVLRRLLWRAFRGNVILKTKEISEKLIDPTTGEEVGKQVFIVIFRGEHLQRKIKGICEAMKATVYQSPQDPEQHITLLKGVTSRLLELKTVIEEGDNHRSQLLQFACSHLQEWIVHVRKVKAIYHILNCFSDNVSSGFLVGECWCAIEDIPKVENVLVEASIRAGSSAPSMLTREETNLISPTYNPTNKFTSGFQSIVDAYGICTYLEVNPALFTIVTFPFLFGIMFGDFGHGLIMFIFASILVLFEDKLSKSKIKDEIWTMLFGGRYVILLMGLFSMHAGFVYNDAFSKSFNIFQSAWSASAHEIHSDNFANFSKLTWLEPRRHVLYANYTSDFAGHPYYYGIDPIWSLSSNTMTFSNSYKMKLSIVIAVVHMLFGICLQIINHIRFQEKIMIIMEFLPMIMFFSFLLVYLVSLIFYKWVAYDAIGSECAPSLLTHLINMAMMRYQSSGAGVSCASLTFYPGQQQIQTFFLIMMILSLPLLLLGKPLTLRREYKKAESKSTPLIDEEQHETRVEFSDLMINQSIHTIEFTLNTISHTASYLRLWALSLAHAELSEVLWNMVLRIGLQQSSYTGCIALFIVFIPFACLTVGILLLMEGLSAFLHAVRLHWVEFQSKFYKGEGFAFEPFSFDSFLKEEV